MLNYKKLGITLVVFALLISGVLFWKTNSTSGTTDDEAFHQGIRNALSEINFSTGNAPVSVSTTTNNLANFINYRSGIQLSQTNKNLLIQNEQYALDNSQRINKYQLAQILTDVAYEKLVTLSDADINSMADNLRGFNTANMPQDYQSIRNLISIRADGEGTMDPNEFVSRLKSIRDDQIAYNGGNQTNSWLINLQRATFLKRVEGEIKQRATTLKDAEPNFFGSSANDEMTPMQAILLTYSVAADDMLVGNQTEVQQKMTEHQQFVSRFGNQSYPGSQGQHAYGVNGYIYSTPLNIVLDDAAMTNILNKIQERRTRNGR